MCNGISIDSTDLQGKMPTATDASVQIPAASDDHDAADICASPSDVTKANAIFVHRSEGSQARTTSTPRATNTLAAQTRCPSPPILSSESRAIGDDLQHCIRTTPKRSVRFADCDTIHHIVSASDLAAHLSDIWFVSADYDRIRRKAQMIVRETDRRQLNKNCRRPRDASKSVGDVVTITPVADAGVAVGRKHVLCTRGLEPFLSTQASAELNQIRRTSIETVVSLSNSTRAHSDGRQQSPLQPQVDYIASAYFGLTSRARWEAVRRAHRDAQEVKRYAGMAMSIHRKITHSSTATEKYNGSVAPFLHQL